MLSQILKRVLAKQVLCGIYHVVSDIHSKSNILANCHASRFFHCSCPECSVFALRFGVCFLGMSSASGGMDSLFSDMREEFNPEC